MPRIKAKELRHENKADFLEYVACLPMQDIGRNARALLTEAGRHLTLPASCIGIVTIRNDLKKLYLTKIYDEDLNAQIRTIESHRWNGTTKSDFWPLTDANHPTAALAALGALFAKLIVIKEDSITVLDGTGSAAAREKPFYGLLPSPVSFTLEDVLEIFEDERPNDTPSRIYIHGEIDERWNAMFKDGVRTDHKDALATQLQSRHELLLFRIGVSDGRPRYLVFPVEPNARLDEDATPVLFADSKPAAAFIAAFKETHTALKHPVLE